MNWTDAVVYLSGSVCGIIIAMGLYYEVVDWNRKRRMKRAHKGNVVTEYPAPEPRDFYGSTPEQLAELKRMFPSNTHIDAFNALTPADIALLAAMNEAFEGEPALEQERRRGL